MRVIKRLHYFVLKTFLPLFAMTFFIVLFIVLMQFLWKYIDDLVGKGLSFSVLAELFFYAAVSMVPMALPLAILLASLMTFGNMGEKFELTAMKASGISLIQVMAPLVVLVSGIAVGAFFFQNDVLPKAQVKMWTLLFSMRQKSPELEIPEGVFYSQIPGFNLYVKEKNQETGMMYGMMIYDVSRGGDNSTIIVADSARLAFTRDMRYLYLHLFSGEQFENLRDQQSIDRNVPFRRESFLDKEVLIPFDANFNRLDEGGMRKQYVGKNISELRHTIDSIGHRIDSVSVGFASSLRHDATPLARVDSARLVDFDKKEARGKMAKINIDSLFDALPAGRKVDVLSKARNFATSQVSSYEFASISMGEEKKSMRRHEIELIKKFTLSVACIIFFFIGAPLGAIIRKGGLGTPLVISVLLFLFYYIIDNTGYKMARDGHIAVWEGIWLSTFILAPLGIYVTYKAMNDSAVFDKDAYMKWARKIFGIREARSVAPKEVIINEVKPSVAEDMLSRLAEESRAFADRYAHFPRYGSFLKRGLDMESLASVDSLLEQTVDYLSDSTDPLVVNKLSQFPLLRRLSVYRPAPNEVIGKVMVWFFPAGVVLWLVGRRYGRSLVKEMRQIAKVATEIKEMIVKTNITSNDNIRE